MLLNLPAARITKGSIFELISEVPYDYSLDFHSFTTFSNLLLNPWWLKSPSKVSEGIESLNSVSLNR